MRAEFTESLDPPLQPPVSAGNAADLVMNPWRSIDRDDDVIHRFGDHCGTLFERQAGSKECDAHAFCAAQARQGRQIGMHERLSAGEDDPLHFEIAKAGEVTRLIPWGWARRTAKRRNPGTAPLSAAINRGASVRHRSSGQL